MRCGYGCSEIRIDPDQFPLKAFTSQHDPLSVRVLLLESNTDFVLVSLDMTSLPQREIEHLKAKVSQKYNTAPDHITVSVTHSFSSPHIAPLVKNEVDRHVSDVLTEAIDQALEEAMDQASASVEETELYYGEAQCSLNISRNVPTEKGWWTGQNPEGYSDHTVRVISLVNQNKTECVLVTYDLQSSLMDKAVMPDGGLHISADLVGEAARQLKNEGITMLFAPGCAADQAPVLDRDYPRDESRYALMEQYGAKFASSVRKAMENSYALNTAAGITLCTRDISLPSQKMLIPTKELTPHLTFDFIPDEEEIKTSVRMLKIDDLAILMCSPELNSSFGRKIREITGSPCLIMTLCDGALKYLAEEDDYEKITYTAMNTMIGRGADTVFLKAVKEMEESL